MSHTRKKDEHFKSNIIKTMNHTAIPPTKIHIQKLVTPHLPAIMEPTASNQNP